MSAESYCVHGGVAGSNECLLCGERAVAKPPGTPADAAMRAAEETVAFLFEEYPDSDMKRGGATERVAAIITRHLAGTSVRQENAVEWLDYAKSELECHAEWWRQMYQPHFQARARQALAMVEDIEKVIAAAATTSPEIPVGGFTCVCCQRNMELRINGKFCNECATFHAAPGTGDDEGQLLTDDDCALVAHAINTARQVQEFIWADCYPALRPYDADGWQRLFQKRVDCIAEVDLTRHGGLAALRKRLLQQAALSIKALALVNRWAQANPPSTPDGADLRAAALRTPEGEEK